LDQARSGIRSGRAAAEKIAGTIKRGTEAPRLIYPNNLDGTVVVPPLAASLPPRSAQSWGMARPQKITFGDMRDMGVRGILILLRRLQVQPSHHDQRRSMGR